MCTHFDPYLASYRSEFPPLFLTGYLEVYGGGRGIWSLGGHAHFQSIEDLFTVRPHQVVQYGLCVWSVCGGVGGGVGVWTYSEWLV